jgi:hypothetical protein
MELLIGETYKTPTHGRYIQVLGIDKEDSQSVTLAIFWVDKDTFATEPGDLVVQKSDLKNWSKVDF